MDNVRLTTGGRVIYSFPNSPGKLILLLLTRMNDFLIVKRIQTRHFKHNFNQTEYLVTERP